MRLALAFLLSLTCCPAARAATMADTVSALLRVDLVRHTPREVMAAIRPFSGKQPASLCGADGADDSSTIRAEPGADVGLVLLPLPPRCETAGEVVGLRLDFAAMDVTAYRQAVAAATAVLGPTCFNGQTPQDPRLPAPAPTITAWKNDGRALLMTRDPARPDVVSVLYADLTARTDPGRNMGQNIRDLIRSSLPTPCQHPP